MKVRMPKISILLITYNHSSYIDEALASILRQDYEGEIDLIIADDASTDETIDIIRSYEVSDVRFKFRYLSNNNNIGITKNYQRAFAACESDYVAIMEGDDIWVHRSKLTKQVALLEEHAECVLCGSNYFVWNKDAGRYTLRTAVERSGFMYMDTPHIIKDNLPGNFSACVYRVDVLRRLPAALFEIKAYDWAVNICASMHGLIAYIHEPLSAYRVHQKGAWSGLETVEKLSGQIEAARQYNVLTDKLYNKEFNELIRILRRRKLIMQKTNVFGAWRVMHGSKRIIKALTPPAFIHILRYLLPPIIISLISRV